MPSFCRLLFSNYSKKFVTGVIYHSTHARKSFMINNRRLLACSSTGIRGYSTEDNKIISSRFRDVVIPDISVTEYVWKRVDEWSDKTAVVCGITDRGYTYSELRKNCERFAKSLLNDGYKSGQVLAIVMPNTPEYPLVMLGAIEAGLVVTTVNPAYTSGEMAKQFTDCNPRVIVTCPEHYDQVVGAIQESHLDQPAIILAPSGSASQKKHEGATDLMQIIGSDSSTSWSGVPVNVNSTVVLPYSSGTTGLPKGVSLTHKNLVAVCVQGIDEPIINTFRPTTATVQEVLPAVLPFYHIFGLSGIIISKLCLGFKLVTFPRFDPAAYLQALVKHKASILFLVPPLVLFMAANPAVTNEHLTHVTTVLSGGAPLGGKDIERFMMKAPRNVKFVQAYGMTEAPLVTVLVPGSTKFSSVGQCVPNTEAKIVSVETGDILGQDEVGEVCIRGPQIMLGYHNNPSATENILDSEGWLHTGDVGFYDQDLDLYIVDRLKELIKVKGFQVAPAELEAVIRTHPGVLDVAVIGIPDERNGEAPIAFVVPKPSATLATLQADIAKYVAGKVADFKHLTGGVRIVDTIPKNPSGKILRKILREEFKK